MRPRPVRHRSWPQEPAQVCQLLQQDLPGWEISVVGRNDGRSLYQARHGRTCVEADTPDAVVHTIDTLCDEEPT